jgi:Syntaxin 6, N-terminal
MTKQDSAANSYELKDVKRQLKRHLKNAESTLNDVSLTVQVVEKDRSKFRYINDKELYDRTTLVHTSRERISRSKNEMNSDAVKAKLLADERARAVRTRTNNAGSSNFAAAELNGDHLQSDTDQHGLGSSDSSQVRTSLLFQHQEETLDELGAAVTRVGHVAETIHDEINQQNKMLTEMEEDLSNVEEELGLVMGKLAKLLKTKDSWQLGTIVCLIGTVVMLFLLVLYT